GVGSAGRAGSCQRALRRDAHRGGCRVADLDPSKLPRAEGGGSRKGMMRELSVWPWRGVNGAPGVTRTPGTQFRKLLLYPPELRGRGDRRRLSIVPCPARSSTYQPKVQEVKV